ncbi:MAG: patatin-like phospholipase family protein [Ardenticatenaceae bacterium]|nr:patatin-like phospholipase family protein [Anaerolineales bacterium]MCB8979854.1 patatin-like phospholipase family protein [Ardenticatenaceae bacterium]
MKEKKVALVIGAGSVKCAASLGVLRVLRQAGIMPDLVVGCSGGALFAAAIAVGLSVDEATALTQQLWTRDLTGRRNHRALLQALLPDRLGFNGRFGLRDDQLILQRLNEALGQQTFAETQIPLFITATDFGTGEQVVLQDSRLTDAIRASIAIPFVFAPWEVNGRLLLDGYLSDPLPVNVAMREGADVIIALGFESPFQPALTSPLRYVFQLSSIMANSMLKARLAFYHQTHHAELLLLMPQFRQRIRLFDTAKFPAIIAAGEEAMAAQLPYLQSAISESVVSKQYSVVSN